MLRNQTNAIVIKPRMSAAVIWLMVGLAVMFVVAAVASAYYVGRWQLEARLEQAQQQLYDQSKLYQGLNERYEQVQASFVQLKAQLHIDDSAYAELHKSLEQSNFELGELRSELKFYRSIITPQDGEQGIRVQEFAITPTANVEKFTYKLVLIQTLQQGEELSATVSLSIKGENAGERTTIQHPGPDQEKIQVNFKYFQNLTGILELPKAFKPLAVKINLAGSKNKALISEKWHPWLQVTAAEAS